jgi:glycosyltransferase involved in cell wall biosynthesis
MPAARIAFVSEPWQYPLVDHAFEAVGRWIYEVARRCAVHHEVIVYAKRRPSLPAAVVADGVEYRTVRGRGLVRFIQAAQRGAPADRPTFAHWLYDLPYALGVAIDVRRRGCDIVHVHNFSQWVPVIRALNPRIKIVMHAHMEWLSQVERAVMEPRLRGSDLILACSEHVAAGIRHRFPEVAGRCHVVHNGVDTDIFAPRPRDRGRLGGRGRLVYAGRLSPEKGVHVLLTAFPTVARCWPGAELEIIGREAVAPREYIVALSDQPRVRALAPLYRSSYLAHLHGLVTPELADKVSFIGELSDRQLAERFRVAELFVHPAVWDEPFGMAALEAMSAGVPVVVSRSGGLPEFVDDGRTGLLVPPNDPAALAAAALRLLADAPLRARMGKAARDQVVRLHSWDRVTATVLGQYDSMLASKGTPRPRAERPELARAW